MHQSISRTTVYHSQSRFTKIVIVIVRDKISGIFMYLTLFTKPEPILELSVANALRRVWWTEGLPVIGGEITTNLVRSS